MNFKGLQVVRVAVPAKVRNAKGQSVKAGTRAVVIRTDEDGTVIARLEKVPGVVGKAPRIKGPAEAFAQTFKGRPKGSKNIVVENIVVENVAAQ